MIIIHLPPNLRSPPFSPAVLWPEPRANTCPRPRAPAASGASASAPEGATRRGGSGAAFRAKHHQSPQLKAWEPPRSLPPPSSFVFKEDWFNLIQREFQFTHMYSFLIDQVFCRKLCSFLIYSNLDEPWMNSTLYFHNSAHHILTSFNYAGE